ncbi:MAG: ComF family protein [Ignavibacterium sp.]
MTNNLLMNLFDLFLPRTCNHCGKILTVDERTLCSICYADILQTNQDFMVKEFNKKFNDKRIINDFYSMYIFEKDKTLQSAIHSFKYSGKYYNAIFLGEKLGEKIIQEKNWNIDYLIPIPLHKLKQIERGYNQSYYISKGLKKILKVSINKKLIKRTKYTQSQTLLNLKERKENMKDAFVVRKNNKIIGKNFLLVDDVITTGATISECGKVLKNAGANKVYASSIAIAEDK